MGNAERQAPPRVLSLVRRRYVPGGDLCLQGAPPLGSSGSGSLPVSVTALVDREYLYRVAREADASAATVKVCVEYLRGGRRVARVDLENFLGQLMRSGRPEWVFLYISEEKVSLVQANQPLSKAMPEWLFDGAGRATMMGEGIVLQDKGKGQAPEEKADQDKGKSPTPEERAENVDKKGSPEHTGEECAQDRDADKKAYLEHDAESGRDSDGYVEEKVLNTQGRVNGTVMELMRKISNTLGRGVDGTVMIMMRKVSNTIGRDMGCSVVQW